MLGLFISDAAKLEIAAINYPSINDRSIRGRYEFNSFGDKYVEAVIEDGVTMTVKAGKTFAYNKASDEVFPLSTSEGVEAACQFSKYLPIKVLETNSYVVFELVEKAS